MSKTSAGILLYRYRQRQLQVFLVHPGGPFWARKDLGAWSIPKGEFNEGDDPLMAALREWEEETGAVPPAGSEAFFPLDPVRQKGGKTVYAWAGEGDIDAEHIRSNTFEMEWPPRSGKKRSYPEVDKAAWFDIPTARQKILEGQLPLINTLVKKLQAADR
jgi:predicted NUDIX family NTP pyrophosphohydrolase